LLNWNHSYPYSSDEHYSARPHCVSLRCFASTSPEKIRTLMFIRSFFPPRIKPIPMQTGLMLQLIFILLLVIATVSHAQNSLQRPQPPAVLVRTIPVVKKMVSDQVSLVGTTEPIKASTVASEVSGIVDTFPVEEGDYIKKGGLLARLRSTDLELRLKGTVAARDKMKAGLLLAEKELQRIKQLKITDSIAEKKLDDTVYQHTALTLDLIRATSEVEGLAYEIEQKNVIAPFSGFVAKEHTQVGQWIPKGGSIVSLIDLGQIRITIDVPERYAIMLSPKSNVTIHIKSISNDPFSGQIYAVLPQGDMKARTFPVRIHLNNPDFSIKSGMEVKVTLNLTDEKEALLIPKDAVVSSGNDKIVFAVQAGKAVSRVVEVLGYYGGDVSVKGDLIPGDQVVIRGNERLRSGQEVTISQ